jgi:glutamyl/glutaminyl-tRNA synthetase
VVNYIALLGWSHPEAKEILSREQMAEAFELSRVNSSPAAFDEQKLRWVNGHHIREDELAVLAEAARPFVESAGLDAGDQRFEKMLDLVRDGVDCLADLPVELEPLYDIPHGVEADAAAWLATPETSALLSALADGLDVVGEDLTEESFTVALKAVGKDLGVKGKDLFMPVRSALTGRTHGPALGKIAVVLGRERVLSRVRAAGTPAS